MTHSYAETGIEIFGDKGSIRGKGIMTQRAVGEVELVDDSGRHPVPFSDHDLYTRSVSRFAQAVAGNGTPAADGIDGIKSLAVAQAVKEAAMTGQKLTVDYAGYQV